MCQLIYKENQAEKTQRVSRGHVVHLFALKKPLAKESGGKTLCNVKQNTAMQNLNLHQRRDHLSLFVGKSAQHWHLSSNFYKTHLAAHIQVF